MIYLSPLTFYRAYKTLSLTLFFTHIILSHLNRHNSACFLNKKTDKTIPIFFLISLSWRASLYYLIFSPLIIKKHECKFMTFFENKKKRSIYFGGKLYKTISFNIQKSNPSSQKIYFYQLLTPYTLLNINLKFSNNSCNDLSVHPLRHIEHTIFLSDI